MRKLLWFILTIPLLANAQEQGIQFTKGLTWQEVQLKAQKEKKYIFLDCYATWCGPCKAMENNVYTLEKAGSYFNDHFINIKVQMDSSQQDGPEEKKWYADAAHIMTTYEVAAFPTFLFFSPNGKIVHKGVGYQDIDLFLETAADAVDPEKQYFTLLNKYQKGQLGAPTMVQLALRARQFGKKALSKQLANDYLQQLPEKQLFTKDNIEALKILTENSNDKSFQFFLKHTSKINYIMDNANFSQGIIDRIITKEEIDNLLWPKGIPLSNDAPDWNKLNYTIAQKYDTTYAKRIITGTKMRWYKYKQQWPEYTKALSNMMELTKGNYMNGFLLNNNAWSIFKYSVNKEELNKATYWMEQLFAQKELETKNSANLDTYANLLYKAGRITDAINWEKKALDLSFQQKDEQGAKTFQSNLDKMKNGTPTWPITE